MNDRERAVNLVQHLSCCKMDRIWFMPEESDYQVAEEVLATVRAEGEKAGAEREREECAKMCDSCIGDSDGSAYADGYDAGRDACASAIRARGKA